MHFQNKTILIAGASSGIGRSVALQLAKKSNRIAILARRGDELSLLAAEIEQLGSQALALPCDALNTLASQQAIDEMAAKFGTVDAALLNIGDGPSFNMSNVTAEAIRHNMDLNYSSLVNLLIPLVAIMKPQGHGLIAHTNSLAGFLGLPMQGPYSAAKAAGRMLMDTCRIELKPFGLKFVSLYPGFVATDRVSDDGIPAPFEISEDKAASLMIRAMEKEKSDYLFPLVTASLIRLALILPKRMREYLLAKSVPEDY